VIHAQLQVNQLVVLKKNAQLQMIHMLVVYAQLQVNQLVVLNKNA
tara:strand:- start:150 stop:284 length:135 start_codon:yes stop_codon:yes gene_type:complete